MAGSASSDPTAAPAQSTTVDPPAVVPPAVVPPAVATPAPAAVLPQPEPATICGDNDYRNADGNCAHQPTPMVTPSEAASPPASSSGSSRGSVDLSALAAKVDPGLVDINTRLSHQNGSVAGTGIVLSASGEVLTNNHVISGGISIDVTDVGNGQTYPATVVGYDRSHDVAVLQLQNACRPPRSGTPAVLRSETRSRRSATRVVAVAPRASSQARSRASATRSLSATTLPAALSTSLG